MNSEKGSILQYQFLGGFAGIGIGVFIYSFVIIDSYIGGLFSREALIGEPINPWIERILVNPKLALLGLSLPMIGFTLMLLFALSIYQLLPKKTWSMTLALAGYLIGSPLVVISFSSVFSLVRFIFVNEDNVSQLNEIIGVELNQFMMTNYIFGPFFIIIIGNCFLSYTAYKLEFFPKWLCLWAMVSAGLLFIGFFAVIYPPLAIGSIGGPLTMLWFIMCGVTLLRRAFSNKVDN